MRNYIATAFNILLIIAITAILGCERQPLDYNYSPNCRIMVNIDWSKSGISPHGATAIFYPQNGNKSIVSIMGTPAGEIVKLPKGIYNVVVFNQTIDEFSYLEFKNIEDYNTFEVYVKPAATKNTNKVSGENIAHPDNFAVDKIENFEVTQQMVEQSRLEQKVFQIDFIPKSVVSTIIISFFAKNIHNIKAAKGTLTGMADCYCVAKGCNGNTASTHSFNLTTIILDDSGELNGTISGIFTTFGLPGQEMAKSGETALNTLNISFLLVDNKTIIEKTYTIDNHINIDSENSGISIDIGTGTKPGEEEAEEDKPIEIPDVKPEEGEGGGMDAEIGDWNEIEIIIPV